MAQGDLILAGIASAMMKSATPAAATPPGTPGTGSSPVTATFSAEQIDQLAGALTDAVGRIEVPPAQVSFPSNLQLSFSDAELARIGAAVAGSGAQPKLIETRVLTLDADGTTVNSVFPTLRRLVTYQFTQSYQLVALSLSCSIVNTQAQVAGLFVGRDLGEFADIGQQSDTDTASDIFISQLTHQNSTLATIAPLSRTNTVAFSGDKQFIQIQGGSRLALYGCGDANAGNLFSAVVNLHLVAP